MALRNTELVQLQWPLTIPYSFASAILERLWLTKEIYCPHAKHFVQIQLMTVRLWALDRHSFQIVLVLTAAGCRLWWSVTGDNDSTKMSGRIFLSSLWWYFMRWPSGYKQRELHREQCKTLLWTTWCLTLEDHGAKLYREIHGVLTWKTAG